MYYICEAKFLLDGSEINIYSTCKKPRIFSMAEKKRQIRGIRRIENQNFTMDGADYSAGFKYRFFVHGCKFIKHS